MELSELELSKNNFPVIINYRTATMEVVTPLFIGILCSLMLCAVIGVFFGIYKDAVEIETDAEIVLEEDEDDNFMLANAEETNDIVLKYFRDIEYKEWVVDFFAGICSSGEIALAVLENSDKFNIPPALAFALSWEESRFNPQAVNRNNRNGSVDYGLFQLNNLSFPNLELSAFYDVQTNAYYGLAHLRYCLDSGSSEVSALAMYNAGYGRIKSTGAPEVTLNYISRILENQRKIESQFHSRLIKEEEYRLAQILPEEKPDNEFQFVFNRTLTSASPL